MAIIAWIVITFIELLIYSIFDDSDRLTILSIEIDEDSVLLGKKYETDRDENGGWKIKTEAPYEIFACVSTERAYRFLLDELAADDEESLRTRIIEARKGVRLLKSPRSRLRIG